MTNASRSDIITECNCGCFWQKLCWCKHSLKAKVIAKVFWQNIIAIMPPPLLSLATLGTVAEMESLLIIIAIANRSDMVDEHDQGYFCQETLPM